MMPSIVQWRGRHARFGLLPPFILLAASLLGTSSAAAPERRAEAAPSAAGAVTTGTTVKLAATARVNLADLARLEAMGLAPKPAVRPLIRDEEGEENEMDEEPGAESLGSIPPEAMITPPPFVPFVASPSPSTSFSGLDDIPMVDSSYIVIPPDVAGGVGPTRVMEGFNNNYRIRDKVTGATVLTVGTATFWNSVITNKTLLNQLSDPRITYDPINNVWIVAMQTVNTTGLILFGVSQTSDPAGTWFLYAVTPGFTMAPRLDFPILGFNKNWLVVTINAYSAALAFQRGGTMIANYPQARAGTLSSVTSVTQAAGTHFCTAPCVTLSAVEDTMFLVTHLSGGSATYQVDHITGTPAVPTYTVGSANTRPGGGWVQPSGQLLPQSAPVSGSSACSPPCVIETQDSQVRSAPTYRVDATTGRGFIYYTQTVGLPSGGLTHTGIQWTKITPSITPAFADGGRIEDATATSTNGGKWYAFPHLAVNSVGDMIVGYTQFGSAQHPSSGYSYRDHADALGTFRDAFICHAGEDYYHKDYGFPRNRWGDFSTAQVDPSDDQTLWTLQEYARTRTSTDDGATDANGSKWGSWWAAVTPPAPTVTLDAGPSIDEGNAGATDFVFTARLSAISASNVTVDYQTSDGTATIANADYQAASSSIVITAGNLTGAIAVLVNGDPKRESNETFTLSLTGATNATVGSPSTATGTILNDDGTPSVSIADVEVVEGNAGTVDAVFAVSLSNATDQTVMVDYSTSDDTATLGNGDYAAASGTLVIPAKEGSVTVTVVVNGDIANEGNETFAVNLTAATSAVIGDGSGTGTIVDDDPGPQVTVIAPNGGEELFTGTPYPVSWSATDVASKTIVGADLYVSNDNGATFDVVALNQPNSGSYEWVPADSVQTNSPASPGPTYIGLFKVVARDADGKVGQDLSDAAFAITNRAKLSVPGSRGLEFALTGVRPIPAPGPVRIGFSLARSAAVRLSIVDLQGRTVAVLADGTLDAGRYETVWRHGAEVPAGVYFASYRAPGEVFTKRFVVTR